MIITNHFYGIGNDTMFFAKWFVIFVDMSLIFVASAIVVIGIIAFCRLVSNLKLRNENLEINNHFKTIDYVERLMSLISLQINKSTAIVLLTKQAVHKKEGIKTITLDDANTIIKDITNHFYSNIPKIVTRKLMFKYITEDQISLLIYSEFINQNNGYYVIKQTGAKT
jgi:hypothetical protein